LIRIVFSFAKTIKIQGKNGTGIDFLPDDFIRSGAWATDFTNMLPIFDGQLPENEQTPWEAA
jgi:hypothetical protein